MTIVTFLLVGAIVCAALGFGCARCVGVWTDYGIKHARTPATAAATFGASVLLLVLVALRPLSVLLIAAAAVLWLLGFPLSLS